MKVKTVAVIGANVSGREIAAAFALAGYQTVLEDVSWEMLERGLDSIKQSLDEAVERGELTPAGGDAALSRIHPVSMIEVAIRDADLIIEAVPEELEMKLELFTIFDKFAKPGAIFASTTSTLSVLDMSDVTVYRNRCIGMRFSRAPEHKKRIELVRTELTSEETISACEQVARRMGRDILLIADIVDARLEGISEG